MNLQAIPMTDSFVILKDVVLRYADKKPTKNIMVEYVFIAYIENINERGNTNHFFYSYTSRVQKIHETKLFRLLYIVHVT